MTVSPKTDAYDPVPGFQRVTYQQPHWSRRKEIIAAHPEIKQLIGPDPRSIFFAITFFSAQVGIAWAIQAYHINYLAMFAIAYFVGAFISHGMWVLIHELTHDLITSSPFVNTLLLLFCNIPHIIPSAVSFRYYHRIHHSHLNETYGDPDMPLPLEAKLFGHSMIGKATWLSLFSVFQSLRVLAAPQPIDWAVIANWTLNLTFSYTIISVLGFQSFLYLLLASLLSVGFLLHPLGGRWLAEHWSAVPGTQETFSYYGSINKFALNIGHHNEHHDFPGIAWSGLKKVRKTAPEFYDTIFSHTSYIKLVWTFITHPNFTLESRVARDSKKKTKEM